MGLYDKIDQLTGAEAAAAERAAGMSLTSLLDEGPSPEIPVLGAIAWQLALRDAKPDDKPLTYDAYMKAHTVREITDYLSDEDGDPDVGADMSAAFPVAGHAEGDPGGAGGDEGGVLSGDGGQPE